MIDQTILKRLRNGVCAVGYLVGPLREYTQNFETAGQFRVVGTGFLVEEEIVLTNGHVIDALEMEMKDSSNDSQQFLMFVVPRPDGKLIITPRQIRHSYCLRNIDVALIRFEIVNPKDFEKVVPVEIDDPRTVRVSEEIAAFGYPHGNSLLEKDGRVHRWGPVLQQGWISGISP